MNISWNISLVLLLYYKKALLKKEKRLYSKKKHFAWTFCMTLCKIAEEGTFFGRKLVVYKLFMSYSIYSKIESCIPATLRKGGCTTNFLLKFSIFLVLKFLITYTNICKHILVIARERERVVWCSFFYNLSKFVYTAN